MCKRNSPQKLQTSMGCVRETPHRKIKPRWMCKRNSQNFFIFFLKPALDVLEKLPRLKKREKKRKKEKKPAWNM